MNLQADPVPEAVAEEFAETALGDQAAGNPVDLPQQGTGANCRHGGVVGTQNQIEDLPQSRRYLAESERNRFIGVVTANARSKIEGHQFTAGQHSAPRRCHAAWHHGDRKRR